MTALVLLLTGWIVVPEVMFAPVVPKPAPGLVGPPAMNYGEAG